MLPLLLLACAAPDADSATPPGPAADLTVRLRWLGGSPELTDWTTARAGLWWSLSALGALPPADEDLALVVIDQPSAGEVLFDLDLGAVGLPEAAFPAVAEAIAEIQAAPSLSRRGGVDVGRFLMRTLHEPWRYYAITGACADLLASEGGVDTDLNSTSWAADQFVSALQQGYCDVILTYWHPSMDFLGPLEVANFEYLTLSTDRYVPVSRTTADGTAEFAFKPGSKEAVPLLSYGAVSALRSVQEFALTQLLPGQKVFVVNQNALANSVKAMIQEGFGIGWLPLSLCRHEIASGRFAIVDERLGTDLEIRLYRDPRSTKQTLDVLWKQLKRSSVKAA